MTESGREYSARSPSVSHGMEHGVSAWNMHNWATNEIEVILADLRVRRFSMIRAVLTRMVYWR